MVAARDEAGCLLWRAELVLEDDSGRHVFAPSAKDPRRGRAGSWTLHLEFASPDGFEVVNVRVARARDEPCDESSCVRPEAWARCLR